VKRVAVAAAAATLAGAAAAWLFVSAGTPGARVPHGPEVVTVAYGDGREVRVEQWKFVYAYRERSALAPYGDGGTTRTRDLLLDVAGNPGFTRAEDCRRFTPEEVASLRFDDGDRSRRR
jgi:hypothetical protein